MLREIPKTSQIPNKPARRWFSGLEMDVFVWLDKDRVVGYQVSYDKPHAEKALAWNPGNGFSHHAVDDGTVPGKHPGSPLLLTDGRPDLQRLVQLLNENFGDTAPEIREFIVSGLIDEYG